jgi:DNA-binding NarL/FixJ family response regulator
MPQGDELSASQSKSIAAADRVFNAAFHSVVPSVPNRTVPVSRPCTVLIEERTFFRQCVLASLQAAEPDHDYLAYESLDAWLEDGAGQTSALILWMTAPAPGALLDAGFAQRLQQVLDLDAAPPVAVMSDHELPECITYVMGKGARAFLPASMGVEMAVKVMDLVRAGGSFIPASTLSAIVPAIDDNLPRAADLAKLLSPRQLAVVRAMRKGLPNKLIAYELAMCESTVKVHVRTIMKKLKAKNRTEVAFVTKDLDNYNRA